MADNNSIKYLRYYHGEKESPFNGVDQNMDMLWSYERGYAICGDDKTIQEYIQDYEALGLGSFCADDGIPEGLKALLFNRYAKTISSLRNAVVPFKDFYSKYYQEPKRIFFDINCKDVWAMARLHHSFLRHIQNHPLWEKEDIPDIPLTEEQLVSFVKGYDPDWDCRYAPFFLGGWFYITRSGCWLKKFKYQKEKDGYYHISEHYSTEFTRGENLLQVIIIEGYFQPSIFNARIIALFDEMAKRNRK